MACGDARILEPAGAAHEVVGEGGWQRERERLAQAAFTQALGAQDRCGQRHALTALCGAERERHVIEVQIATGDQPFDTGRLQVFRPGVGHLREVNERVLREVGRRAQRRGAVAGADRAETAML